MVLCDVVFPAPSKETNVVNCRCGPLIDLCRGPHVRHTGKIKALKIHKVSPQSVCCSVHFKVPPWDERNESCVGPCSKCRRRKHICPRFQSGSARCVSLWGGWDAPKGTVETNIVPAVCVCKNSSTYWEGKADMETLQRIYGISFPDPKMLKEWEKFQEEAKNRDHRKLGRV